MDPDQAQRDLDPLRELTGDGRRRLSQEIRERRSVLTQIYRMLPTSLVAGNTELSEDPNGRGWVVRDNGSNVLGTLRNRNLAQFLRDAVQHLEVLSSYIERMEREAFENRDKYRRQNQLIRTLRDELLAADEHGPNTQAGQHRVRQAVQALRDDLHTWRDEDESPRSSFTTSTPS